MIMEAGNLPSTICKLNTEASWLNWTLTGIIESKSKGLRTRNTKGKRRPRRSAPAESEFSLLLSYCSIRVLNTWDGGHPHW